MTPTSNELNHALSQLLALSQAEQEARGLVFTPREIAQQPRTWQKTFQTVAREQPRLREFLEDSGIGSAATNRPAVFLIGAGTSDYIGGALAPLLRKQWQCLVEAVPSTDLLTDMEERILPSQSYLWISFSRSGDSSESVAVIDLALQSYPQVRHLIVTCNQNGKMAQQFLQHKNVCCLVLDEETNDRGLAMTSSFSNMVIAGHCLAHFENLSDYKPTMESLAQSGEQALQRAADVASHLAQESYAKVCFLGSGALKAVAREASLKVLELTDGKVLTLAESFLGIRHGPLSALDDETLVVAFLSGEARRQAYEADLLAELRRKRLGKKIVVVSPHHDLLPKGLADEAIQLEHPLPDEYRPPLDVILAQLIGLFFSIQHGLKPDTPSPGGAISRVVENVKLHQ